MIKIARSIQGNLAHCQEAKQISSHRFAKATHYQLAPKVIIYGINESYKAAGPDWTSLGPKENLKARKKGSPLHP